MPKVPRSLSTHLFKYVNSVDIRFNPFDVRTRSARELLRQVSADRYKSSNPKLKINTVIDAKPDAPKVEFKFVDGSDINFDSQEFQCQEMLDEIFSHTINLDNQYEMDGKSIDD